jgi:hypothetical protein
MHVAANPITGRAAADYPKYHLRRGADSDVDVFRCTDSKDNFEGHSSGEKVSDGYNNLIIYDSEQVTGSMPNACCSTDGTSDDRKCGSRGEEMKNYDVCNTGRFGRYEEGNVGDAKPTTDAYNSIKDETAVTTDQLREMINELENLTSDQKQKLTAVLMKYQVNLTKTSGKCKDPYIISRLIAPSTYELSATRGKSRGDFIIRSLSLAKKKKTLMRKAENKVMVMRLGSSVFAT